MKNIFNFHRDQEVVEIREIYMEMKKTIVNCPQCGNSVIWQNESRFRPFCSKRCKLIDTGNWAMEKYSVAAEDKLSNDESD